jgi:feruloyl esterase
MHPSTGTGSFGMNPGGTINTVLWNDFAQRGIHQMAVKTKALTRAYYGKDAKYAYWDGFSTGGRQGHKLAQVASRGLRRDPGRRAGDQLDPIHHQ